MRNAVNEPNLNILTVKLYSLVYISIFALCFSGTLIGKVNATDKDLANTSHTKIKFTLLNATDMFSIDPFTGVLTAKTNTLDREVLCLCVKGLLFVSTVLYFQMSWIQSGNTVLHMLMIFIPPPQAQDKVYVNIEIRDMAGDPNGLFNRGTVVITLTDVNDNPPTFKEKLVSPFYCLYSNITKQVNY